MNHEKKKSVLTLLYALVLIDNQVKKVELTEFFNATEDFLTNTEDGEAFPTRLYIADWFSGNYEIILRKMKSSNRVIFLLGHAENLKYYQHRQIIFDKMKSIAMADHEYHPIERKFLEKIAQIWELETADDRQL